MRITRLEAQNIGPFEDLKIDFKEKVIKDKAEIHILTGENGTGKSTVLEMITDSICHDSSILNNLRLYNLNRKIRHPKKANFKVTYNENESTKFDTKNKQLQIAQNLESVQTGLVKYSYSKTLEKFSHELHNFESNYFDFGFFGYSGYRRVGSQPIGGIVEISENPFTNALSLNTSINPSLLLQWIANTKAKEAFAFAKGDDSKRIKYQKSINQIESAISEIISKPIEFILEDEPIGVKIKVQNDVLDFDTLPDGLKSIISWLSDLLMRLDRINWADKSKSILEQNFILFLDEIEVHLHPSWQRKILPVVQDLFPNAQIFISTHSPFVVGSVDGAWVYKFKLDENNNSVLDKEPYLTEDGYSYDRILEETFGITERFGIGVQKQLEEFRTYKNKILAGEDVDNEAFMKLAKEIADQSIELNSTIGFEIRQIERLTKKTLETV